QVLARGLVRLLLVRHGHDSYRSSRYGLHRPSDTPLFFAILTTLFNAGIIPTYLIVQATGLLNTVWAMIIPTTVSVFNVLILKTFFEGIPSSLFEAARVDGLGGWRILLQIVLPLSLPVLMTIG